METIALGRRPRTYFSDECARLFGKKPRYYDCIPEKIAGCDVMVTASGFSTEMGYEIYLRDATKNAEKMWNTMLEAGKKHNLKVIAPGHHRRIEAGMMSYGQDIDIEVGREWQWRGFTSLLLGKRILEWGHCEEPSLFAHKL